MSFEAIGRSLTCPVSQEIMNKAVTLYPCKHIVQKRIAVEIFSNKEELSHTCPRCPYQVISYEADHHIRKLAKAYLLLNLEIKQLPTSSIKVDPDKVLPYPGVAAKFVYYWGSWEDREAYKDIRRSISFLSVNDDSLIKCFTLIGYTSGKVECDIRFGVYDFTTLKNYLGQNGFLLENDFFKTTHPRQLKNLFKLVAQNNEFPEDFIPEIRGIIEAGKIKPKK